MTKRWREPEYRKRSDKETVRRYRKRLAEIDAETDKLEADIRATKARLS